MTFFELKLICVYKNGRSWYFFIIIVYVCSGGLYFSRLSMAFFTSEYECKLDTKGRLVLPAKIKANLPDVSTTELVMRRGFEPGLILYPMVEYRKIHQKISSLSEFDPDQRRLKRTFFRSIAQVELDSANRINIPKPMLAHAQIEKEALLIGTGNNIEIWNPQVFDRHMISDAREYSELAQRFLNE